MGTWKVVEAGKEQTWKDKSRACDLLPHSPKLVLSCMTAFYKTWTQSDLIKAMF